MKTGDVIIIKYNGLKTDATIIDVCYRQTAERCTMLVRLNDAPSTELEINVEAVESNG